MPGRQRLCGGGRRGHDGAHLPRDAAELDLGRRRQHHGDRPAARLAQGRYAAMCLLAELRIGARHGTGARPPDRRSCHERMDAMSTETEARRLSQDIALAMQAACCASRLRPPWSGAFCDSRLGGRRFGARCSAPSAPAADLIDAILAACDATRVPDECCAICACPPDDGPACAVVRHCSPSTRWTPARCTRCCACARRYSWSSRPAVFQDIDGLDPQALHLTGWSADGLVAYARCFPAGVSFAEASIGRVVTSGAARGAGWGHLLIDAGVAGGACALGPAAGPDRRAAHA
jgi:hypothetical protein